MKKEFYSNGKLLISGEYAVLDGALGFAIPSSYGQSLHVTPTTSGFLEWTSLDENKEVWFSGNRTRIRKVDDIPWPSWDLIPIENYLDNRHGFGVDRGRSMPIIATRGCPYKCSFCSIHIHAGRKYRRYSVEHVLNHIENLTKNYGVRHIHFEDDNLTLDRQRFMELMNGIIDRGLKFTWDTPNGTFANALDEEMMYLIKKTGCTYLCYLNLDLQRRETILHKKDNV